MSGIGIDKIVCRIPDYQIDSPHSRLTYRGHDMEKGQVPFKKCANGEDLVGKGYYLNQSKKNGLPCTVDLDQWGMKIQFNPSSYLHDYNLTTDCEPVLKDIRSHLNSLGIDADIERMQLKRVDLAKNAVLRNPIHTYVDSFRMLKASRMSHKEYPSGFNWGNTQAQSILYSKYEHMASRGVETTPNLTRVENRWTGAKSIGGMKTGVGCGYVIDLLNKTDKELNDHYTTFLNRKVFRTDRGQQLQIDWSHRVEVVKTLKEERPRSAWNDYQKMVGIETLLLELGGVKGVERFALDCGYSRSQAWRIANEARTSMQKKGFMDNAQGKYTIATSIEELKQKFAS